MKKAIIAALCALGLLSAGAEQSDPLLNTQELLDELSFKNGDTIAFLGDSITQAGSYDDGYIRLFEKVIRSLGIEQYAFFERGVGGNTSADMLARVDNDVVAYHPTWTTYSAGVNDICYTGKTQTLEQYQANVTATFDKLDACGTKVIVFTTTVVSEQTGESALDPYVTWLRSEANRRGYRIAEMNTAMKDELIARGATGSTPWKLTTDGIHLNADGNKIMAWELLKAFGIDASHKDEIYGIFASGDPVATPYPKAVWREGTKTLTFYYNTHSYTNDDDVTKEYAIGADGEKTWDAVLPDVEHAAFDLSFVYFMPTDCTAWFRNASKLKDIDRLDYLNTVNCQSTGQMFGDCGSLTNLNLGFFNTAKVMNMFQMFRNMSSITELDLSSFDTSNVQNFWMMFLGDSSLKRIIVSDKFVVTDKVTDGSEMFSGCTSLVGGNGTTFDPAKDTSAMAHVDVDGNPGYLTLVGTTPVDPQEDDPQDEHVHVWGDWTTNTPPTTTSTGLRTHTCIADGCTVPPATENEVIPMLTDDPQEDDPVVPGQLDHWEFDEASKTMTDGEWTFTALMRYDMIDGSIYPIWVEGCTGYPDHLTTLNFDKPVVYVGYPSIKLAITQIQPAFNGSEAGQRIKVLKLPTHGYPFNIGDRYTQVPGFYNCHNLERVEPFLPDSCVALGRATFQGCEKLASPLVWKGGSGMLKPTDPEWEGNYAVGWELFEGTAIPSADLSESSLRTVDRMFRSCTALKTAKLPTDLAVFDNPFNGDTALELVEFNSVPNSLSGFEGCSSLKEVRFNHTAPSGPNAIQTLIYNAIYTEHQPIATYLVLDSTESDKLEIWKNYATGGVINGSDSTWSATYAGDANLSKRRPLLLYSAQEELAVSVASPVATANSIGFNVVVGNLGEFASVDLLVQVSKNSDYSNPVYNTTVVTGLSEPGSIPVAVTGLEPLTTYYVRVQPTAGDEVKDWIVADPITTLEHNALRVGEPTARTTSESARIQLKIISIGEGATAAEVSVAWGTDPNNLASSATVTSSAKEGDEISYLIEGLEKNTPYYYALTVRNDADPSESVTTATGRFEITEISDAIGMYEGYPTGSAVPAGYVVTFVASDTANPYYVVPASAYTYPVNGADMAFYFRDDSDFRANASACIGDNHYLFLSDAVDASSSGDTIELIRDNNFVEKTMVIDKPLTINGNGHTVKVAHPFVGNDSFVDLGCTTKIRTIFRIRSGGDVVLRDMTVMGGGEYLPPSDGEENPGSNNADIEAIVVSDGTSTSDTGTGVLQMENVTISRSQGALFVARGASVMIDRCQIVRNCRFCAGGVYNEGTVVMNETSLSENRSLAPAGGGGAAENKHIMYINNCVICNNSSTEVGGAINNFNGGSEVNLYMMNTTVAGNFTTFENQDTQEGAGGGIGLRAWAGGKFSAVNCLICNNHYYDEDSGRVYVNDIRPIGGSTQNDILYSVYGDYDARQPNTETRLTGAFQVDVSDSGTVVFIDERDSYRVYANAKMTESEVSGPMLRSAPDQEFARYAPIADDGAAVIADGVWTYFDASGWRTGDVKMSYRTATGAMTALGDLQPADSDKCVTAFYETHIVPGTVEREPGIVGASGRAVDRQYQLILLEKTVNGSVGNISILGTTYPAGTEVTVTATPDSGYSFLGWYDADDQLVSAAAAYTVTMDRDIGLMAKFEISPTHRFIHIKCEQQSGAHGEFDLVVAKSWLKSAFPTICPDGEVGGNETQIEGLLNARDEVNGLNHVWMNYVLGGMMPGDPNGRIWIRADQSSDPATLRLRMQQFAPIRDSGFTVRYRLCTKSADASVFPRGLAYAENSTFDKDFGSQQSVHHVIDMIFIPDGFTSSEEYVTTVNTAGVLKVESEKRVEILSSPWAGFSPTNNPPAKATDYVKASCLTTNDVLYVYDQVNSNYLAWAVQVDRTFKPVKTWILDNGIVKDASADATRTNAVPRGTGVWLERHDTTSPIYLYGQVDDSSVVTPLAKGWNLVGNPYGETLDINRLVPVTTDKIMIPTGDAPLNCTYKNEKWGYTVNLDVKDGDGKVIGKRPTRITEGTAIPVGHGFWYISSGEGKITWGKEAR